MSKLSQYVVAVRGPRLKPQLFPFFHLRNAKRFATAMRKKKLDVIIGRRPAILNGETIFFKSRRRG